MCGGWLGDVFRIGTTVAAVAVAVYTGNPFAIVAAVGAVASTVGHYTNSKELKIAGTVLGAVGAIGGLANAAGLFELADIGLSNVDFGVKGLVDGALGVGGAAGLAADGGIAGSFDAAKAAANAAGPVTVDTMSDMVGVAGGVASPEMGWPGGSNPLSSVMANADASSVLPEAAVNTGLSEGITPNVGMINQPVSASGGDSAMLGTFGQEAPPVTGTATPPGTEAAPGGPGTMINAGDPAPAVPVTGGVAPTTTGANGLPSTESLLAAGNATKPGFGMERMTPSVFDKMWGFLESNGGGRLVSGALMAGGAFMSGATNSKTPAEIDALKAQAEANKAAANLSRQQQALLQQQQANASEAQPVATRTPAVTGSVAPAPPRGLINQPKLAPVTGVPA